MAFISSDFLKPEVTELLCYEIIHRVKMKGKQDTENGIDLLVFRPTYQILR